MRPPLRVQTPVTAFSGALAFLGLGRLTVQVKVPVILFAIKSLSVTNL